MYRKLLVQKNCLTTSKLDVYKRQVVGISGDISNGEDAKRMVAEAIEKLGSVDVLVNNCLLYTSRCV